MVRFIQLTHAIGGLALFIGSGAQALQCTNSRTRIEKAICASASLRQQDRNLEKAYADALARAPAKSRELRSSQISWLADRDAGCATPDRNALYRCLEAQYRLRTEALAIMAPVALAPPTRGTPASAAARAAPAPTATPKALAPAAQAPAAAPQRSAAPANDIVKSASYVSDAVLLRLDPDGRFEMKELSGSRKASGHYVYNAGVLTLLDASGDVGRTKFPLHCQVQRTVSGFAVSLGQSTCRPFDGIAFRLAS